MVNTRKNNYLLPSQERQLHLMVNKIRGNQNPVCKVSNKDSNSQLSQIDLRSKFSQEEI